MNKNVFLVRNVAPNKYGGGEIYQLKLADKLKGAGFSPIIVTNSRKLIEKSKKSGYLVLIPPYSKNQNWSGARNVLLPCYYFFQLRLKKWFEKAIKDYRPVVINIQSRDEMIAGTMAARKFGVKVLWTDHADFKNWVLWNVNVRFKNIIGKRIIKLSRDTDGVIFVSEKLAEETRDLISPKKLHNVMVIKNGVTDEYREMKTSSIKPMSFVFVGRVVREKGIGELIEAFHEVAKLFPEATLSVYGDGNIDFYKKMSSDCKKIHYYGSTDNPLKALAENRIFVLPSYMEGLSLALLEAAMMGKTIIATDVGGNSEIIKDGETGFLVSPRNAHELAEKMIYILRHENEAIRLSKRARAFYEKNYDFDKIFAKSILPLYNREKEER